MKKSAFRGIFSVVILLCLLMGAPYLGAFARDGNGHDRDSHNRGRREVIYVNQHKYNYRDGRFYRPSWFGFEFSINAAPVGAVVTYLPYGYKTRAHSGITYYYYDNTYYRSCPGGYVVVPVPVSSGSTPVVSPQRSYYGETVVINVPNRNGTYTPITLVKQNGGYIGPQGEYYDGNPNVEQLRALYGK